MVGQESPGVTASSRSEGHEGFLPQPESSVWSSRLRQYALVMVLLSSLIDKSYYIAGPITDICTHSRLQPLFRDNLGKPVPERSNQTGFK